MNFPKNIKITIEKDRVANVRPYLLNSDIEIIESQVANVKSKQQRRNIVQTLVMRFCTDIEEFDTDELDINILDIYRVNGIVSMVMTTLDKESFFAVEELINIEVGDEIREVKLLVLDLINSVNNIESGKAEESIKNSIKALEEAKAKLSTDMK